MIALGAMLCWAGCHSPTEPTTESHAARVYIEPRVDGVYYATIIDGDTVNSGFSTVPLAIDIEWTAQAVGAKIDGNRDQRGPHGNR